MKGLIPVGRASIPCEVDVYRDGDVVTVVGGVEHVQKTPHGAARTIVGFVSRFDSVAAYDWAKALAFERAPLAYTRIVGALGVDDDARNAPPTPPEIRRMMTTRAGASRSRPEQPVRHALPASVSVAGDFQLGSRDERDGRGGSR